MASQRTLVKTLRVSNFHSPDCPDPNPFCPTNDPLPAPPFSPFPFPLQSLLRSHIRSTSPLVATSPPLPSSCPCAYPPAPTAPAEAA